MQISIPPVIPPEEKPFRMDHLPKIHLPAMIPRKPPVAEAGAAALISRRCDDGMISFNVKNIVQLVLSLLRT